MLLIHHILGLKPNKGYHCQRFRSVPQGTQLHKKPNGEVEKQEACHSQIPDAVRRLV